MTRGATTGIGASAIPRLSLGPAPHFQPLSTYASIVRAYLLVGCLPLAWGVAMYGPAALGVAAVSVAAAVATQYGVSLVRRQHSKLEIRHSAMLGLILALTLPATVTWSVPVVAAVVAVLLGKAAFGGVGRYFWHPVALGRVVVQLIFADQLDPSRWVAAYRWPVLAKGWLGWGSLDAACEPVRYAGWSTALATDGCQGWLLIRPVRLLRWLGEETGQLPQYADRLTVVVRDLLPPWSDAALGLTGGGIGEGCVAVLAVAAIYLAYRGYARGVVVVAVMAGAALAAAVLPIRAEDTGWTALPILIADQGLPIGLAYVLYHLVSGELMLVACLLAGETVTNPVRPHGQVLYALGLGAMVVALRLYGPMPCSGYWALLAMNTMVPLTDRCCRGRVLGT